MATEAREDLVRRAWDAYDRGDIEATLAIFDPAVLIHVPVNMANAGNHHGKEGFVAWLAQWNEAWESFTATVIGVETVGERHVLTQISQSGVGRGSGVEVTMQTGWVFELADGLCTYLSVHPNLEAARAEASSRERIG
jgi:ketosteroid isomerase-like protein